MNKKEISDDTIARLMKVMLEVLKFSDQEIQDILNGRKVIDQRELKRKFIKLSNGG